MGVLDKFLNVMRLNPEDDDDFYNEDYDYDDDYTEAVSYTHLTLPTIA